MSNISHGFDETLIRESVSKLLNAALEETDSSGKKKYTQEGLGGDIGIEQPRISQLKNKRNHLITLKEAILLADRLDVSLDELVGRLQKGKTDVSCSGICQIIVDLIMAGKIRIGQIVIDEPKPPETDDDDFCFDDPEFWVDQKSEYPTIYFSPYQSNFKMDYIDASQINGLLEDLVELQKLHERGALKEHNLQSILNERLKEIREIEKRYPTRNSLPLLDNK